MLRFLNYTNGKITQITQSLVVLFFNELQRTFQNCRIKVKIVFTFPDWEESTDVLVDVLSERHPEELGSSCDELLRCINILISAKNGTTTALIGLWKLPDIIRLFYSCERGLTSPPLAESQEILASPISLNCLLGILFDSEILIMTTAGFGKGKILYIVKKWI